MTIPPSGKSAHASTSHRKKEGVALIKEIEDRNPFETERVEQAWYYPEGFTMPTLEVQAERIKRVLGVELKWPDGA